MIYDTQKEAGFCLFCFFAIGYLSSTDGQF